MRGGRRRRPLCAASHAYAACHTSSGRGHVVAALELRDRQHAGLARVRADLERRDVLALAADGEQPAAVVGEPLGVLVGAVLHGARLGEDLRAVEQRHERVARAPVRPTSHGSVITPGPSCSTRRMRLSQLLAAHSAVSKAISGRHGTTMSVCARVCVARECQA